MFDLSEVFTLKTFDELKEMLNEHYYCKTEDSDTSDNTPTNTNQTTPTEPEPELATATVDSGSVDDDIDDLLKDL